jgi:hypothetical protein
MDFGIAKMTTSTRLTATGQTMGTVRYMSPEQVRGQEVDLRTDLYSLGATLYEALVGDTPFDGNTHFEIMTKHLHEPPRPPSVLGIELPPQLETIVLKSLQKKLDDRFQNAREMRKALEEVLKAADLGLAETQRLARDSVSPVALAAAQVGVGRTAGPAATTAPGGRVAQPPERQKPSEPTGLADRLEPSAAVEAIPRKKSRSWIWLGLAGVVAAAGAAVAVMMLQSDDDGGGAKAAKPRDASTGSGVVQPDEPFLPPDVPIVASQEDSGVRVHVSTDWKPAEVLHVWGVVRGRFERLAAEHQVGVTIPKPFTIVVVPGRVFCDPRTYEEGKAPEDCATLGQFYRPEEQTLLVRDDRAELPINLGVGLASAVCVHTGDRVCDLINPFEALLRKGS